MRKAAPFSLCSSAMRGQVLSRSRMAVMVAFSLISVPSLPESRDGLGPEEGPDVRPHQQ